MDLELHLLRVLVLHRAVLPQLVLPQLVLPQLVRPQLVAVQAVAGAVVPVALLLRTVTDAPSLQLGFSFLKPSFVALKS